MKLKMTLSQTDMLPPVRGEHSLSKYKLDDQTYSVVFNLTKDCSTTEKFIRIMDTMLKEDILNCSYNFYPSVQVDTFFKMKKKELMKKMLDYGMDKDRPGIAAQPGMDSGMGVKSEVASFMGGKKRRRKRSKKHTPKKMVWKWSTPRGIIKPGKDKHKKRSAVPPNNLRIKRKNNVPGVRNGISKIPRMRRRV